MSTLSPSKHTGMIRIRFIYLYCLVIVVDNDRSIFSLASPFSHKFVAFKLISYPISILLLYLNSSINSWIPSIAQFTDLAFSCLVWSCEASRKAQTSIESLPKICCFADGLCHRPMTKGVYNQILGRELQKLLVLVLTQIDNTRKETEKWINPGLNWEPSV